MTPVLFLFWSQVPVLNKLEYFICFTGSIFLSHFSGLSDFTSAWGEVKNRVHIARQILLGFPLTSEGVPKAAGAGCISDTQPHSPAKYK